MDTQTLIDTRQALHVVAEHVLAGDLARRTGRIGLRPTPGGFGQPEVTVDGVRRRIRVDGTDLVVLTDDTERWEPLTTAAAAAAFAGTDLAPPEGSYAPETTADPAAPLAIDPTAAGRLADWFALVGDALEQVRRNHAADGPTIVQLWPEHFDVACVLNEINLGGSPGDGDHDEPYLYAGPWEPRTGSFWNESWGASVAWSDVADPQTAVAFLEEALAHAAAP